MRYKVYKKGKEIKEAECSIYFADLIGELSRVSYSNEKENIIGIIKKDIITPIRKYIHGKYNINIRKEKIKHNLLLLLYRSYCKKEKMTENCVYNIEVIENQKELKVMNVSTGLKEKEFLGLINMLNITESDVKKSIDEYNEMKTEYLLQSRIIGETILSMFNSLCYLKKKNLNNAVVEICLTLLCLVQSDWSNIFGRYFEKYNISHVVIDNLYAIAQRVILKYNIKKSEIDGLLLWGMSRAYYESVENKQKIKGIGVIVMFYSVIMYSILADYTPNDIYDNYKRTLKEINDYFSEKK